MSSRERRIVHLKAPARPGRTCAPKAEGEGLATLCGGLPQRAYRAECSTAVVNSLALSGAQNAHPRRHGDPRTPSVRMPSGESRRRHHRRHCHASPGVAALGSGSPGWAGRRRAIRALPMLLRFKARPRAEPRSFAGAGQNRRQGAAGAAAGRGASASVSREQRTQSSRQLPSESMTHG